MIRRAMEDNPEDVDSKESDQPDESGSNGAPGEPKPRDVLAAEAFAVGAGDPALHHEPARDVLAADEFPVPAPEPHSVPPDWQAPSSAPGDSTGLASRPSRARRLAGLVLLVAGLAWALAKRRRRP